MPLAFPPSLQSERQRKAKIKGSKKAISALNQQGNKGMMSVGPLALNLRMVS